MTTQTITKTVYVVTRNSRRIEDKNYSSREDANKRAKNLIDVLKTWKDPDATKVKVIETEKPNKIR